MTAAWDSSSGAWDSWQNSSSWDADSWKDSSWDTSGGQTNDSSWNADQWKGSSWDASATNNDNAWGGYGGGGQGWSSCSWAPELEKKKLDWRQIELVKIEKDFWHEHPDVQKLSEKQVKEIRERHDIELLDGTDLAVPRPVSTFVEAAFPDWITSRLHDKFKDGQPTPIQIQVWPIALQGRDLIGIAETGSGKTLAYSCPMLVHIVAQDELTAGEGPVGVVLCPTRELAVQICEVIQSFAGPSGVRCLAIYGGGDVRQQADALKEKNDVIVATPGRFIQLLNDGHTNLNRVTYVVLDEADEMLRKDFGDQIRLILNQVRPDRQMLMFSATWPREVQALAKQHCTASGGKDPVTVRIGGDRLVACRNIEQQILVLNAENDKIAKLAACIKKSNCDRPGSRHKCLVFVRSKNTADDVYWKLRSDYNVETEVIHSGKKQSDRFWALREFKQGELSCVISTDCLGRGHDIPRVRYVINYDPPDQIEDYVHRIGRTGRAGEKGYAMIFMTQKDHMFAEPLVEILRATNQKVDNELEEMAAAARKEVVNETWGSWGDGDTNAWSSYTRQDQAPAEPSE